MKFPKAMLYPSSCFVYIEYSTLLTISKQYLQLILFDTARIATLVRCGLHFLLCPCDISILHIIVVNGVVRVAIICINRPFLDDSSFFPEFMMKLLSKHQTKFADICGYFS